jgi:hypothetical protein
MPKLQILVWHDFSQIQVAILVLSTLLGLCKYATHVVVLDSYHMEIIPSLVIVIEHKYQSQQGYVKICLYHNCLNLGFICMKIFTLSIHPHNFFKIKVIQKHKGSSIKIVCV